MRYFRFLPLVLIACFVAYLLLAFKLCPLEEFYNITGNTWGYARLEESYTFLDMLKIGLFTSFFKGTQLVSPFWCLHYIFLGSMLSFVMMLLYTKIDNKIFFFGSAIVLFYFVDQNYLAFIIGLIAGIIANKEYSLSKAKGALLVFVGCVLGLFPPVLLPSFIDVVTLYALGAGFVIVGIHCCFSNNRLLCNRFAEFLGKESLALIVWQFLIMQSLNIFLYNYFFRAGMKDPMNIAINFAINMVVSVLVTWASSKIITPLTNYTCNKVSGLLLKQTQYGCDSSTIIRSLKQERKIIMKWKSMPLSHKIATIIAGLAVVVWLIHQVKPTMFSVDPTYPAIAVVTVCEAVVYWKDKRKWACLLIAAAVICLACFLLELMLL